MSKFLHPCIIRKNTPELRKKLEELGKTLNEKSIKHGDALGSCKGDKYLIFESWRIKTPKGTIIDCGDNEELFLAIAAIREDSDTTPEELIEHFNKEVK